MSSINPLVLGEFDSTLLFVVVVIFFFLSVGYIKHFKLMTSFS